MILAKPLRTKDIGHLSGAAHDITPEPTHTQIVSKSYPNKNQLDISRTTVKEISSTDRKKLLLYIIKDEPGVSHGGILQIMREFCKTQHFHDKAIEYSSTLQQMLKEGTIKRIQIMGRWRYIPNHVK